MTKIKSAMLIILSGLSLAAAAQTKSTSPVWTNRVSRLVYMGDSVENGKKKTNTFAQALTNMVYAEKVPVYSTLDTKFTTLLTPSYIKGKIAPVDTFVIEDPVTGEKMQKVVNSKVDYGHVRYFRVIEEWSYDIEKGTAHIQIVGAAPIKDEYSEDGIFRGRSAMYWVKFEDMLPVLDQYEKKYPDQSLFKALLKNYAESNEL